MSNETSHPVAFIQWQGTDVCMDFTCDCGDGGHFDGYSAYHIKCPACGAIYKMPEYVKPEMVESSNGVTPLEIGD